jgi:hypothetical protein
MRRTLAGAWLLFSATAASAESRAMHTIWMIQPAPAPTEERALASGEFVLKQRLLPSGLAEIEPAAGESAAADLPAGAQLIEVQTSGAKVFCSARVAKQKLIGHAQICLVDSDMDNRFEGMFRTSSATKGLVTISGSRPKRPKAIQPIPYRMVDPSQMEEEFYVAIERRNYFNIYSSESFMIAFGREGEWDRITAPIQFRSAELPKELTVLGARFTALSEAGGKMIVRVDAPMPPQPFGVLKTTTYR